MRSDRSHIAPIKLVPCGSRTTHVVKGENGKVKSIYDLQGRKVENPAKGIYIIDGKKIFVK